MLAKQDNLVKLKRILYNLFMEQHFKYRNIAISSKPGAGRSTLYNNLRLILEPLGWQFFSGGEFSRQYAIENGLFEKTKAHHHDATIYTDEVDLKIDTETRKKLEEEDRFVVESWIAGYNVRGVSGVLKVLLICDEALRIDRIVNRDNLTVEEAKRHLHEREQKNLTKWKRMYGTVDFWNPKLYDLVIDTYSSGPMETLGKVLDKLGYRNHHS